MLFYVQPLLSCKIFTQKEIRLSPSGRATNWKSVLQGDGVGYLSTLLISKEKRQMTQFSPLIGRHGCFLKGNAETIMAVMNAQIKTV